MALIRATCSECGDVELRNRELQVRICGDTGDGSYLFRCPVCRMIEVKNADDQVIDILAAAGVRCVEWRLPAELNERPTGEPFTSDDLIDFHQLMASDDWWLALDRVMTRVKSLLATIDAALSPEAEVQPEEAQIAPPCVDTDSAFAAEVSQEAADDITHAGGLFPAFTQGVSPQTSAAGPSVDWSVILHSAFPLPPAVLLPEEAE